MTRQRNSLATRRAIYDDHGGEMRFWLSWVHGEIDGAVQNWLRTQARHDPALQQDIDSADAPAARQDVRRALEATAYLIPVPATAAEPTVVEDLDDVTSLVLGEHSPPPRPAPTRERLAPRAAAPPVPARAAARLRSTVIADFRPEEVIAGTRKGLN